MKIIESTVLDSSSEANYTYKRNHDIRIQTHSNKHTQLKSVQYFSNSFKLRRMYVGDSNENLKSVTKNWNIARFSCKLATLLLMV
jgi:hypothetical protein